MTDYQDLLNRASKFKDTMNILNKLFKFKTTRYKQTLTDLQLSVINEVDLLLSSRCSATEPPGFVKIHYIRVPIEIVLLGKTNIITEITNQISNSDSLYIPRSIAFVCTNGDYEFYYATRGVLEDNPLLVRIFFGLLDYTNKARTQLTDQPK